MSRYEPSAGGYSGAFSYPSAPPPPPQASAPRRRSGLGAAALVLALLALLFGWIPIVGLVMVPPALLATFPAVGGIPTIVVGSAERTGKSSGEWLLTLLHEHFHQWQSSLPEYYARADALGLARGDTTGQWMLNYPFPYDSAPVQRAAEALAASLARGETPDAVTRLRQALRRTLSPDDDRYLEFQLWQEGVPRYLEIAVAEAAAGAGEPSQAFRRLPDYQGYADLAIRLRNELDRRLEDLSLGRERRIAFYALGAGMARLLDGNDEGWKRRYRENLFTLLP